MIAINLEGIDPIVSNRITPFIDDILKVYRQDIHSIHIVGSAVTPDFSEKTSDINSLILLNEMKLDFVEFLAPLGKKYGKKRIAAPLVMTPDYIENSLDVFPVEFHDFRLIHKTIYGEDILKGLQIDNEHLRLQCEREIKIKLISLRQGYIGSIGDKGLISTLLIKSFTGCIPLFRAIIYLLGHKPPVRRFDVIKAIESVFTDSNVFEELLLLRNNQIKPSKAEISRIFKQYYTAIEKIAGKINELQP